MIVQTIVNDFLLKKSKQPLIQNNCLGIQSNVNFLPTKFCQYKKIYYF